jgi:voltage-gated potassium channel
MLRILKVNRYTDALSAVGDVLKRKASQLVSSMLVVLVMMIIASVLMYYIEYEAQPEVFENAFSGVWWAVATLTTVGYGDIYPITAPGKMLSTVISLLGIGLVAVPTGIISAGFLEQMNLDADKSGEEARYCPHCGKKLK